MNLDRPEGRQAYLDAHGHDAYKRAMAAHIDKATVSTVNGHPIRKVPSRFGTLYAIGGTSMAYATQAKAEDEAAKLPAREAPNVP